MAEELPKEDDMSLFTVFKCLCSVVSVLVGIGCAVLGTSFVHFPLLVLIILSLATASPEAAFLARLGALALTTSRGD